jgi:hypothetical protein
MAILGGEQLSLQGPKDSTVTSSFRIRENRLLEHDISRQVEVIRLFSGRLKSVVNEPS